MGFTALTEQGELGLYHSLVVVHGNIIASLRPMMRGEVRTPEVHPLMFQTVMDSLHLETQQKAPVTAWTATDRSLRRETGYAVSVRLYS